MSKNKPWRKRQSRSWRFSFHKYFTTFFYLFTFFNHFALSFFFYTFLTHTYTHDTRRRPQRHDVTKIQTKKLSILLSFYFHEVLQHLKTFIYTSLRFQRVLRFAIEDAWISRLCVTRHLAGARESSYVGLKRHWFLGIFLSKHSLS